MQHELGTAAGRIWSYLDQAKGEVTVLKLKSQLGMNNSLLYMALGWLAREEKITLVERDRGYMVSLRRK